jgi:hypothetical protein
MSLIVDYQKASRNIDLILRGTIPGLSRKAMKLVANRLVNDALTVTPTVPKGHRRAKAGKRGGVGGTLRRAYRIEVIDENTLLVGFDTPYATYQEEGKREDGSHVVKHWSEPGSGAKFLSKKIIMFGDAYVKIVADYIRANGGA